MALFNYWFLIGGYLYCNAIGNVLEVHLSNEAIRVEPNLCPLCNLDNRCGNLTDCGDDCWCTSPDISFTNKLLNKVPDELKGKACICKACALAQG